MMITSTNPMVYTNPVVYTDFPDPDIIRVGDVYYMATTTMHFTPGCDILRSYDLVHWEFIAHALNIVADTPEERLECEGANAYGRGMWAPSLRYHRGTWYVLFAANDTHTSYLLTADDPCGPWRKRELDGFYHDSGLFFLGKATLYLGVFVTDAPDDAHGSRLIAAAARRIYDQFR